MQVYGGLPILTALPSAREQQGVPHHLFGQINPDQNWSTGKWLRQVKTQIEEIRSRDKTVILVGGTGLYFESLTKGLAKIPHVSDEVFTRVSNLADTEGLDALRVRLERVDPAAAARILGADRQRLIRGYSVFEQTGKTITSYQENTKPVLSADEYAAMVLLPPREKLYARIEARFDQMMENGALDELRGFVEKWPAADFPLAKAIGVQALRQYLAGDLSIEAATELAKRDTRRYAKRQMTWARGRTKHWQHFASNDAALAHWIGTEK